MNLQVVNTLYYIQHNGMSKVTKCTLEYTRWFKYDRD